MEMFIIPGTILVGLFAMLMTGVYLYKYTRAEEIGLLRDEVKVANISIENLTKKVDDFHAIGKEMEIKMVSLSDRINSVSQAVPQQRRAGPMPMMPSRNEM